MTVEQITNAFGALVFRESDVYVVPVEDRIDHDNEPDADATSEEIE